MTNPERLWNGPDGDDGSVHIVGNGLIAAYGCGPNLFNIFGPPYSGPSWGALTLTDSGLTCRAWREPGTAIWHYRLADAQGNEVAEFTDVAVAGHALLARQCRCRQPLTLSLRLADDKARHFATTNPAAQMLFSPRGRTYYWEYPLTDPGFCLVAVGGAAELAAADARTMTIRLAAGESLLTFAAAGTLPEATLTSEWAAATGWDGLLDRTRRQWAAALAPLSPLPAAGELDPARLAWMVDSTATQILAQQGLTGGVLAGHNYRMAYGATSMASSAACWTWACTRRRARSWRDIGVSSRLKVPSTTPSRSALRGRFTFTRKTAARSPATLCARPRTGSPPRATTL